MEWGELNWPQVSKIDKSKVVVIPLASCEQHGRHLPLLTDTILVTRVTDEVKKLLPELVLVFPTLWLGASHHHLDFPGTVSVTGSLYSRIIKSIAECIVKAGFKRIFFLNGHGGNEAPGAVGLTELVNQSDAADSAHIAFQSYWYVAQDAIKPEQHGMVQPRLTHSDEYETSLMLFIRPELVSMKDAVTNKPIFESRWWSSEIKGNVNIFKRFQRKTARGSIGFPDKATEAKGSSLLKAITGEVAAFIKDFSEWPDLPVQMKK